MATVQQIYIAIFGRPADPVGLAYWNEQTNNGADLSAMIAAFTAAPEYEARFEGQSNEEIISSIYQSLFGREPDDEGLEFYAEALANGELPIETIAVRILDGAQNEDQTSIENKTEAADKFTASIDTPEEIEAYQGTQAATEAQEFLETVNDDPESVPSDEDVDQAVKEVNEGDYNPPEEEPEVPGGPGGDGNGVVRALTSDNDTISTGSGDDIINASAKNSLSIGDDIDGGAGDDELNISAGAIADDAAPTISGVETINNFHFGTYDGDTAIPDGEGLKGGQRDVVTLDLNDVDEASLTTLRSDFSKVDIDDGLPGNSRVIYYEHASSKTEFVIANVATQGAPEDFPDFYKAHVAIGGLVNTDTLNLTLQDNKAASYYAANSAATTVDILAAEGNDGELVLSNHADIMDITVAGAGDLAFTSVAYGNLTSFNASGASGDIDFATTELSVGAKLTGGTGDNDSLTLGSSGSLDLPTAIKAFETITLNGAVSGSDDELVIDGTEIVTLNANANIATDLTANTLTSAILNLAAGVEVDFGSINAANLETLTVDLGENGSLNGPSGGAMGALEKVVVSGDTSSNIDLGFGPTEASLNTIDLSGMAGYSAIRVHGDSVDGGFIGPLDILIGEGGLQYGTAGITPNDNSETFSFVGTDIGNVDIYKFEASGEDADRLDFSGFEGVTSVSDLGFETVGDDTVITSAAFTDGAITVVGVDIDSSDSVFSF